MPTAPSPQPDWFPLRWQLNDRPSPGWSPEGLSGQTPLPWWSAGWYGGELQSLLRALRRDPHPAPLLRRLSPLREALAALAASTETRELWLVPVPGWRSQPNPVPQLLAQTLQQQADPAHRCRLRSELLQRNWRVLPQHRLGRQQRWRNQWLSFRALLPQHPASVETARVLLIDDVLTSGATALAAQRALHSAGWRVAGLLCLARTPRRSPAAAAENRA
ncbi:MAG: ComF family protein [Cyanobacteria bacterium K_Offshore_0m_m2_072]|nr:ComF family protein [Cyanobacteria bacterium K_Offshore_0m_m2_072]